MTPALWAILFVVLANFIMIVFTFALIMNRIHDLNDNVHIIIKKIASF